MDNQSQSSECSEDLVEDVAAWFALLSALQDCVYLFLEGHHDSIDVADRWVGRAILRSCLVLLFSCVQVLADLADFLECPGSVVGS